MCWDLLQSASPRTVSDWEQADSRPQLSAQTLLGASVAESGQADLGSTSRVGPWIPTLAFLGLLVIVGALVGLVWTLGGSSAVAAVQQDPTGAWSAKATNLDAEKLNELRVAGWNCPVVEAAGFQLASATGIRTKENAQVHIVLKRNASEVTLTETRKLAGNALATGKLAAVEMPVSKKSGTEVLDSTLTELGHRLGAQAGATVDFAKGTATLSMDEVKYTITSNLSKKDLESLLQRLVIGEHAHFGGFDASPDQVGERLMRGLSKLMVLDLN